MKTGIRLCLWLSICALTVLASCSKKADQQNTQPVVHTVSLISPVSNSSNIPNTQTFTCAAVPGALLYTFSFLPLHNAFGSSSITQTSVSNNISISNLITGETYTWSVSVSTQDSGTYTSTSWSFAVGGGSGGSGPTLTQPANLADNVCTSPTLTWSAVTGASAYDVEVTVQTGSGLSGAVVHSHTVSGTSYTLPASILSSSEGYYWRVAVSGTGAYSGRNYFNTINAPTPLTPPNGNGISNNTVTLTWSALPCTSDYVVELARVSDFSSITRTINVSGTSTTVINLSTGFQYYWRVRDANGVTYGTVWSFYN